MPDCSAACATGFAIEGRTKASDPKGFVRILNNLEFRERWSSFNDFYLYREIAQCVSEILA